MTYCQLGHCEMRSSRVRTLGVVIERIAECHNYLNPLRQLRLSDKLFSLRLLL